MLDLLVNHGSYAGIIIFLILTGCGLPLPEELAIITAAVLALNEQIDPWLGFLACLVGAIVGDCVMYAIGHHWGHGLLKEHPRFARFLHAEREAKFEGMIRRHGLKVLFLARFMVGVRSPVYLSAGILRVGFRRFLLMDLLCATSVVGTFYGLTYAFGEHIVRWLRHAEIGLTIVVLLAVTVVVAFVYRRGRRRLARLAEVRRVRSQRNTERRDRKLDRKRGSLA